MRAAEQIILIEGQQAAVAPLSLSPSQVSGLQLWLKADTGAFSDAGTTPAVNNATVEQWNDQSGSGHNASQATSGNRPTFKTNIFNALPALLFTGSNNTVGSYLSHTYTGEPVTIFVVHCPLAPSGGGVSAYDNPLLGADSSNAGGTLGSYYLKASGGLGVGQQVETTGPAEWFRINTAGGVFGSPMSSAVNVLDILAVRSGATTPQLLRQNVPGAASTLTGTASPITNPVIGAVWYPTGTIEQTFNGYICEVVMYNRALTNLEYSQVLTGLQNKWGMTYSGQYFYPCFLRNATAATEVHSALYLFQSPDLVNWKYRPVNCLPSPANAAANNVIRDVDILLAAESPNTGGLYWLCACTYPPTTVEPWHTFDIYNSSDLSTWTYVSTVDVSAYTGTGANSALVNTSWFVDGDGSIHVILGARNNSSQDTVIEVHPTNAGMTTWSAPVDIFGGVYTGFPTNMNGPNVTLYQGTYYLDFTDGGTGSNSAPWMASSSSLTSGWAVIKSGDWAGWFASIGAIEQTSRILAGGTWHVFMDNPFGPNGASYATSAAIPGVPSNPPIALTTNLVNGSTMADGNIVP